MKLYVREYNKTKGLMLIQIFQQTLYELLNVAGLFLFNFALCFDRHEVLYKHNYLWLINVLVF